MGCNVPERLGKRLHEIREHRGMSQRLLARTIGVAVGTIQNYEHGRVQMTTKRIEQLAHALQCEPSELLKSSGSALPKYHFAGSREHLRTDYRRDALDHLRAIWDQIRAELRATGIEIGDQPARDWIDTIEQRMGRSISPRAAREAYQRIRERLQWYAKFEAENGGQNADRTSKSTKRDQSR
jgi:transcriptional regulator with XRE-family HTH domain